MSEPRAIQQTVALGFLGMAAALMLLAPVLAAATPAPTEMTWQSCSRGLLQLPAILTRRTDPHCPVVIVE
jgi:hypothetical protein